MNILEAAKKGDSTAVLNLINAGVNVNTRDGWGNTALMWAAWMGHIDVVKLLINTEANVNALDNDSQTALMKAADKGYSDISDLLIDATTNVDAKDKNGLTALIIAAQNGHVKIIRKLIQAKTNIHVQDHNGLTALLWASLSAHHDVVHILKEEGALTTFANDNHVKAAVVSRLSAPLMNATPLPNRAAPSTLTPKGLATVSPYAGFWKRVGAMVIDQVIGVIGGGVAIYAVSIFLATTGVDKQSATALYSPSIISLLVSWLYFALMESSQNQATLGKLVFGIKVTDLSGASISFGKASARYFGKIVSSLVLGIGYLMVVFTEKKQGLHDILAGCLVVNETP